MTVNPALFTSLSEEWATPQDFFDRLNVVYSFTLDPCATAENAKCERFFDRQINGLSLPWTGERVFMNPPYGRGIGRWIEKAATEFSLTVALLPVRTDTAWWQTWVEPNPRATVEFIRGRLRFGGAESSAPFPSCLVTFANWART